MLQGRPSRQAIYEQYQAALADLRRRGGLPTPDKAMTAWRDLWFVECHHSTALEGNTLVLKEVKELLAQGRAVGGKPLADYLEVEGYAKAAQWVYEQAHGPAELPHDDLITLTEVRRTHELAMSDVWNVRPHPDAYPDEGPGNWRRHEHLPFPDGMVTAFPTDVPSLMRDWVSVANQLTEDHRPLPEVLAEIHDRFEQIHPFLDGNGRTGRLALNLLLVRLGHPPLVILKKDRERYLRALRKADAGDNGPLAELLARALIEGIHRFVLPVLATPTDLIPLVAAAKPGTKIATLARAAERGRLRAIKGDGGRWMTTKEWVAEYLSGRYQRPGVGR